MTVTIRYFQGSNQGSKMVYNLSLSSACSLNPVLAVVLGGLAVLLSLVCPADAQQRAHATSVFQLAVRFTQGATVV